MSRATTDKVKIDRMQNKLRYGGKTPPNKHDPVMRTNLRWQHSRSSEHRRQANILHGYCHHPYRRGDTQVRLTKPEACHHGLQHLEQYITFLSSQCIAHYQDSSINQSSSCRMKQATSLILIKAYQWMNLNRRLPPCQILLKDRLQRQYLKDRKGRTMFDGLNRQPWRSLSQYQDPYTILQHEKISIHQSTYSFTQLNHYMLY